MTDRDQLVQQIADDVRALVEPRRHVEPYFVWGRGGHRVIRAHTTEQPSLLDQLRLGGAAVAEDAAGRGAFESRPPNAFDCFARLRDIEAGSAWWVSVAWRMPLRPDVEGNLHVMVGRATDPALRDVDLREVAADVRRWHTWASVLTGWKTPPWTPRASCPHCGTVGSLRVRLDEKQAACMACDATWDEATIGLLADHIRSETSEQDTPSDGPDLTSAMSGSDDPVRADGLCPQAGDQA